MSPNPKIETLIEAALLPIRNARTLAALREEVRRLVEQAILAKGTEDK